MHRVRGMVTGSWGHRAGAAAGVGLGRARDDEVSLCGGGDPCWWSQNHHISRSFPRNSQQVLHPCPAWCPGSPHWALPARAPGRRMAGVAWAHSWGRQGRRHPAVQRELPRASLISAAADFPSPEEGRLPEGGHPCSLPGLGPLHQTTPSLNLPMSPSPSVL